MSGNTVTVNLNVNVDATGDIEVFGSTADSRSNVIIAKETIPVNALYDNTKNVVNGVTMGAGLIEFWEPAADLGNIHAKLATTAAFNLNGAASYEGTAKVLACGLQKVLVGELDCSSVTPFDDSRYSGTNADSYRKIQGFGRVALSAYAHYLFGHAAATAAITNDEAFMSKMLSLADGNLGVKENGSKEQRYDAWSDTKTIVDGGLVSTWSAEQTADNANLAVALVKKLIGKATAAPLSATRNTTHRQANDATVKFGPDTLANIVKQVIGQDASRAMGQDNNALEPDVHHMLRFIPGDKIVVNITLQKPNTVTVSGDSLAQEAQKGEPSKNDFTETSYAIEIALGARSTAYDVPV